MRATIPTPWGDAQPDDVTNHGPGIDWIDTPSHGGFRLSPDARARMPEPYKSVPLFQNPPGNGVVAQHRPTWFEEDCDAALIYCAFPEYFPRERVEACREYLQLLARSELAVGWWRLLFLTPDRELTMYHEQRLSFTLRAVEDPGAIDAARSAILSAAIAAGVAHDVDVDYGAGRVEAVEGTAPDRPEPGRVTAWRLARSAKADAHKPPGTLTMDAAIANARTARTDGNVTLNSLPLSTEPLEVEDNPAVWVRESKAARYDSYSGRE
jgi:hypothetical protein